MLSCKDVESGLGLDAGGSAGETASSGDEAPLPGSTDDAADASTSTSDGDAEGTKLDVGSPDTTGDDPPTVAPTCATITEHPATSLGCVFWGADLPPDSGADGFMYPFGIAVGNPSASEVATIRIEDRRGDGGTLRELTSFELMPGESRMTRINGTDSLLEGQNHALLDGVNALASFRVTADVPVTATQFNLVGGAQTEMPEASTLLPEHVMGTSYLSLCGPMNARAAVLAVRDGTTLTTPTGDVQLDAFDAWYGTLPDDASSGVWFSADQPVAMFSGSSVTFIGDVCCSDSLQEQLVPLDAWGTSYVAARHPHRLPAANPEPEAVYWKVVAAEPDTTIAFTPPIPGIGDEINLAALGDVLDFTSTESFVATSDQRFMLVQFMASASTITLPDPYASFGGDPFMAQTPAIDQWLEELPFLTDDSYAYDFVTIAREAGTTVELDCLGVVSDDHFVAIPGTPYEVGQVFLDDPDTGGEGDCVDGQQFLRADRPVGILVGGYDSWASYGYPGGMGIAALWEPPTEPPG